MPIFPVLASTAEVGLGVNSSHFEPNRVSHRKCRGQRDVEPAVGVKQNGILLIQLQPLFGSDEHGDAGTVFAVVENLLGFILAGIEVDVGLAEDRGLPFRKVIPVDRGGTDEAGKRVERFLVLALAAEALSGADARKIDDVQEFAFEIEQANFGLGILEIAENKFVVDDISVLELVGPLGDERLPVSALGMASVDGDDAPPWSIEIGFDPEDLTVVVDEAVLGIEVV